MYILPQIPQIPQRNAASCIITQRKTGCLRLKLFCCFRFCLRKSAGSAGESAVSFVLIDWVLLREYSPADYADHAEECSKAALYRRERQVVWGCCSYCYFVVLGFVCVNLRDLRETLGLICANRLSKLDVYSPADSADDAEECSRLHYIAEKDRLFEVKAVLWFCGLSA